MELERLPNATISPLMKVRPTESSNRKDLEVQILNEDIKNLKCEATKIKKKLELLNHEIMVPTEAVALKWSLQKLNHYNGHTISDMKLFIRSSDSIAKVVDSVVLKKLFTTDEILNCSITSKRSTKSSDEGPHPALDQERFNVFMDIILSSCEASRKEIVDNPQKAQNFTTVTINTAYILCRTLRIIYV
ncbi:Hypothetical predicted protein [Paramuricea clavata]|uniref:BEN domain-containing protein n=1 Tax=Paramuricea clavata TaxID=317549 RepID=A0A7D9LJ92_PARCT|nr:Hypothetical predicted protein [Paramuricea clavata]